MEENLAQNPQELNSEAKIVNSPIKPKKAFKKWGLVAIILILILSLPIGGYLLLGKMGIQLKPSTVTIKTTNPTPIQNIEASDFPELTASEEATWKTYTDSKSSFSIKYPPNFTFYDSGSNDYANGTVAVSFFIKPQNLKITRLPDETPNLQIAWRGNEKGLNNDTVQMEIRGRLQQNKKYFEFNNVYAVQFNNGFNYYFTEKNKNQLVYLVYYDSNFVSATPQTEDLKKIFRKMLSTFKFTDQSSAIPTCKPRPACLDATPRCMIPETSDMCPRTTLKISEYGVQVVLTDDIKDAYYVGTTANKGYVYLKVHSLDSEPQCKKDDSSTAALSRVGKDDINPMNETKYSDSFKGKTIGNYFYYIDLAQYSCAESPSGKTILEKVRKAFTNAEIIQ